MNAKYLRCDHCKCPEQRKAFKLGPHKKSKMTFKLWWTVQNGVILLYSACSSLEVEGLSTTRKAYIRVRKTINYTCEGGLCL